jgi:hypothetical protein
MPIREEYEDRQIKQNHAEHILEDPDVNCWIELLTDWFAYSCHKIRS